MSYFIYKWVIGKICQEIVFLWWHYIYIYSFFRVLLLKVVYNKQLRVSLI